MSYAQITNPRSVLHALQPLGVGTGDAESLLSYFCRLAASHCTSTLELSRKLLTYMGYEYSTKYAWYDRQISGLGNGALTYTSALAATTTVDGLQLLTFLPWQKVIASNGLALNKAGKYCPQCLYEDQQKGHTPYFRLCWEPTHVTVCHRHHVELQQYCPNCNESNVRHTCAFTVVGWCGKCGTFLGRETPAQIADELALWQAQQIASLVELQQSSTIAPDKEAVIHCIEQIIEHACSGQYAGLARHIGIAKSTVHTWLKEKRTPGLDMSLRIARFASIKLSDLLLGTVELTDLNSLSPQLKLPLDYPSRPAWNRRVLAHDWELVEIQLQAILKQPMPVSVMHAASVVRIPARMLYMHCNLTTRKIAHRWLEFLKRRQEAHIVNAWPYLEKACRLLLDLGISPNMREIERLVPAEILNRICGCWVVLRQVREHIESSEIATSSICNSKYPQKLVTD